MVMTTSKPNGYVDILPCSQPIQTYVNATPRGALAVHLLEGTRCSSLGRDVRHDDCSDVMVGGLGTCGIQNTQLSQC